MNKSTVLYNLRQHLSRQLIYNSKHYSSSVEEKIIIPKRIPRGPTDILQALASTIKKDPTAPHYKYHDDPYLIPMSNIGKRTFAMAQEAGRKAAHWVRQEHADLFQHKHAEPEIKAFVPKIFFNENSEVTEETLKSVVKDAEVSSAITVYKILEKNKVKLSQDTLQSLLELLCFYNSEDTLPEEFIEERWFRSGNKGKDRLRKTWKDSDMAESIFISIENPDSAAYCALIQGMAKYFQVDRCWQLYEEMKSKNLEVTTETYNSLISVASFLKEGYDLRWKLVQDLLICMQKEHQLPNIGTLNAILETLSTMTGYRQSKNCVLQTLAEFKTLGIEPSLASWYFVLITFCKERGPKNYILADIINYVEGKEFKIVDIKDTFFFVTAMDICRNHLNDKDLAYRVDKLLHTGNNYDLIGDSYKESIYYRHYFALLCTTEPLEIFMEQYRKLVPNIYIPEPGVMLEVIQAVEVNAALEYVPKIWSDMVLFDHTDRENLLNSILNIMAENKVPDGSDLTEKFARIGWDIWTKIEEQPTDRIKRLNFTGQMLGDIMTLCLRNKEFEKASLVMQKLDKEPHTILGVPRIDSLKLFIEHCISEKAPTKAINCVQYLVENGFDEAGQLAKEINEKLTLDETHINKLMNIVGKDVLKTEQK